ncbi:MAG: CDP-alcohol phosphatidyltransferase family protein, partial [Gemmatimonadota bacterium]
MSAGRPGPGVWTVPNAVSALRLFGLAPLLWAAHEGHRSLLVVILVALLISDWIDGKLAAR